MATITLRPQADGSKSYRVDIRLKGHSRQQATFERLTDAKRWAAATESAIREGRHFPTPEAKRHSLTDVIERYTREVLPTKKDGPHQTRQLAWWKAQIGKRTLADVTPALIAETPDRLAAQPTPRGPTASLSTVVRYLAALSHAFTIAVKEWQWVESNPLAKVSKPKEPRGRVRFPSDEEREGLLAACKTSRSPDLYPAVIYWP